MVGGVHKYSLSKIVAFGFVTACQVCIAIGGESEQTCCHYLVGLNVFYELCIHQHSLYLSNIYYTAVLLVMI